MKHNIDGFSPVYFKAPDELLTFYRDLADQENRLLRSCFIDALEHYKNIIQKPNTEKLPLDSNAPKEKQIEETENILDIDDLLTPMPEKEKLRDGIA